MKRALASLLIALATLLAVEGALTALAGTSLLRRWDWLGARLARGTDPAMRAITEEQSWAAAASNPGILALHADPRVGWTLRPSAELRIYDGKFRTTPEGIRRRAGPPPPADAIHVVLLGGSIPFGYGMNDDQTMAHQLELALAASRGPEAPAVVVHTVAVPRWSTRNAVSFLLDHLDVYQPDLVLWMPFQNDLYDTDIVNQTGRRTTWPDAASPDPWLNISSEILSRRFAQLMTAIRDGKSAVTHAELGTQVLMADLSPESTRRYDESIASITHLHAVLTARGARMVMLQLTENRHRWHLRARLAKRGPQLPVVELAREIPAEHTLGFDPHPDAETHRVVALWIAEALLENGWIDRGEGKPLPGVPADFRALRSEPRSVIEVQRFSAGERARDRAELQSVIDFRSGLGVMQVYGGLGMTGLVGPRLSVLLKRAGRTLNLELAPLPDRPELYPLQIEVQADGVIIGHVTLRAAATLKASIPLRRPSSADAPLEVKLSAPDWVIVKDSEGRAPAAYRPLRMACEAGD